MPKTRYAQFIALAIAFALPTYLFAQQGGALDPKASDPDFLESLEKKFNEDLGRPEGSPDYVHLYGRGKPHTSVPLGARAMAVLFSNKAPKDGVVGQGDANDGSATIFYDEVFEITTDPFEEEGALPPFWPDYIPTFSIILLHEAQHLPTDGGDEMPDFPEGLMGPGMPVYVPAEDDLFDNEMSCAHLKLHIDSYRDACDSLAALIASHDASSPLTDNCDEIDILCRLNKAAEKKLNSPPLNAEPYISECDCQCGGPVHGEYGWVMSCGECDDFFLFSCSPGYGEPPIIVGPNDAVLFNHSNPYQE